MQGKIHSNINIKRIKRQILSHVKLVRFIALSIILSIVFIFSFFSYVLIKNSFIGTSINLASDFVFPDKNRILTNNGRVNVLILGTAGPGRGKTDEDITDTMIFVSVSIPSNKITLISIPRDIWVPNLKDKINASYMYGKQKGGIKTGIILAKSTIEEVLGEDLDYGIVIDFSSFKDIVNAIGGIDVNVQNGFTDRQYPIAGKENDNCNGDTTFACRYETITFQKGNQDMDGETALKFVRSRHAEGEEGNDLARQKRQQLVVNTIFRKIITPKVFTNIGADRKLLRILQDNIKTDMTKEELVTLARYLFNSRKNISSNTIPENLLYNPSNQYLYHNNLYTHAFVFIPARKDDKWIDVQNWVREQLN